MPSDKRILILEDCADREYRMRSALLDRMPMYDVEVYRTANECVERIQATSPSEWLLISLDHDLIPTDASDDWGDGRDVANALSTITPSCPVVIHSTNTDAVIEMTHTLESSGWPVYRVIPVDGHSWIRRVWFRTIRDLIVDTACETESATISN